MIAERLIPESSITPVFKKLVWLYRDAMPVIVALRSEYLQDEHWKEVKSLLKSDFSIDNDDFTLSQFLQLPVQSCQE
jgi:dynein heavy chain